MSHPMISAHNLGKQYRLGSALSHDTLRDHIVDGVMRLFRARRSAPRVNGDEFIWALKDVSFEVAQGEVVGIIGRNGAGKSTLLKILSQITEPTEGEVRVRGRIASLLEVGTGFHPELSGRENIYLNGAILGMTKAEIKRKFDEIISFADLEKFLDTPVKRYSSGMYMRLAFAVAAHLDPEILVVDEVLAVGDAEFQKKCLGKMREVGKGGRTVLFVTHNMNAVEQLCGKAIVLENGRVKLITSDVTSAIKTYLFTANDASNRSLWANSGGEFENPWFKPTRFRLADRDGNPLRMPVGNDLDIWVEMDAEIQKLDSSLTVGYAIYAEDGNLLYWSYHVDEGEDLRPSLKAGRCTLRSQIPPRFLNEGTYRLELIGGLHSKQWLFTPGLKVPFIYLEIQGGLSNSPYWTRKRPGHLAPVMHWDATAG
jgi:homopolymeric O-antigen transport system ATP-binding protein